MAVQIVVYYNDGRRAYFPVPPNQSWRVSTSDRCLVIGTGVPRMFVPLDNVDAYEVELVAQPCACPMGTVPCASNSEPDSVYCASCKMGCAENRPSVAISTQPR